MARACDLCAKGPKKAANRSHALNKTLRTQKPNLQKFGSLLICTKCRKTVNKHMMKGTKIAENA